MQESLLIQNVEVTMQIYTSAQEVLFDCHKKRRDLEKAGVRVKPTALQKVYHILQAREMIGEKLTVPKACLAREAVLRQKTGKGKTENPQKL